MFYLQCITRIQLLSNIMLQQPSLTSNNSVTSFILCLSGKLRIYIHILLAIVHVLRSVWSYVY